ncbi:MAG: 6-phosphogluconolactonase [Bacteroidales bacterium]
MIIKKFNSKDDLAECASEIIINEIRHKPDLLLCTATGSSPTEIYRNLSEKKYRFATDKLRILKLDEWGGIDMENPESCESYLQKNVIQPLQILPQRFISFHSNAESPDHEIERIKSELLKNGPIDVCILGLGLNGHIAFNEPAECLLPECHLVALSSESMNHPMAKKMNQKPGYGLTIGMADILKSKKIIMVISGKNKEAVKEKLFKKEISTWLPASFLWLHGNTECLVLDE